MREIDHIVYAVPNLTSASDQIEQLLGVRPVYGGKHPAMGTENALVNLSQGIYLELLAADHSIKIADGFRWMGVDLISEPTLTRWAVKSNDLHDDLSVLRPYDPNLALLSKGQRITQKGDTLQWSMLVPQPKPVVEIIPFAVDWAGSDTHPADDSPSGCELHSIKLFHPKPEYLQPILTNLGVAYAIHWGPHPKIDIEIRSQNGKIIKL